MIVPQQLFWQGLLPVFFVLALGFYAGRRRIIDNQNIASVNTMLTHFLLPCSLFLGVGRTSLAVLRSHAALLAVLAVAMLLTYAAVYVMQAKVFGRSPSETAVQALTVSFANNVAVGLPLLASLYGSLGLLAVAAAIIAGVLVVTPITLVVLECHSPAVKAEDCPMSQRILKAVGASVHRPVILAPLCALVIPLCHQTIPQALVPTLDLAGKATIGVALFLTGIILSAHRLEFSAAAWFGVALKNIVQPALVFAAIFVFHLHHELAQETFLLAAVPAGFFGTVFGARYGVRSVEVSSTLLLSTLFGIVTLPLAILLCRYLP
jgi:malonate transporter and related proteins